MSQETGNPNANRMVDHGRISRRAYELYLERGGEPGFDVEDWLRAEREVIDEEALRTSIAENTATHNQSPAPSEKIGKEQRARGAKAGS